MNDYIYDMDGWQERQGSCLPSPLVAEEAEFPAAMVCAVAVGAFVLGAACWLRWTVAS